MIKFSRYTIPQTDSQTLREVLAKTKSKALALQIKAELEARKAAGVDRPLTIEDFLG